MATIVVNMFYTKISEEHSKLTPYGIHELENNFSALGSLSLKNI